MPVKTLIENNIYRFYFNFWKKKRTIVCHNMPYDVLSFTFFMENVEVLNIIWKISFSLQNENPMKTCYKNRWKHFKKFYIDFFKTSELFSHSFWVGYQILASISNNNISHSVLSIISLQIVVHILFWRCVFSLKRDLLMIWKSGLLCLRSGKQVTILSYNLLSENVSNWYTVK